MQHGTAGFWKNLIATRPAAVFMAFPLAHVWDSETTSLVGAVGSVIFEKGREARIFGKKIWSAS